MTENEINSVKARNIEWLSQAKDLSVFGLCVATQDACCKFFLEVCEFAGHSFDKLFATMEKAFGLVAGMGLNIYKHLAYWKQIYFDADERVDLAKLHRYSNPRYDGGVA